jgi:hypothetical protein
MNDCRLPSGNWRQEQDPAYDLLQPIFYGVSVTDPEAWAAAAAAVQAEYAALPTMLKQEVTRLLTEIGMRKEKSASLVDAAALCAACRGICCGFGKHHFSVVDLLGYLVAGRELFTPRFDNPLCPYHAGTGCVMEPALRPLTCTIFICEQIDACLDDAVKLALTEIEQQLRRLYGQLEQLLGNRFENGLLITYERSRISGEHLFRY